MTDEQLIVRGKQAEMALEQFLSPAFEHVMDAYRDRLLEIAADALTEGDKGKIAKLALARRIAATVQEQIVAFVRDGDAAMSAKKASDKIANMSEARRAALQGMFR